MMDIQRLFEKIFWDWWDKPKIKFGLNNSEPHVITTLGNGHTLIKYFRLKIINEGKTVSKNCHVKLISVIAVGKDRNLIEPDRLKWSSIATEKIDIPPGGWEFCDLFKLESSLLTIIQFISSGNNRNVPIKGDYIITIEIFGDNIKPKIAKFRTTYSRPNDWWNIKLSFLKK